MHEQKNTFYAIIMQVLALPVFPAIGFLITVVMWAAKKDEDPFVDHHGRESIRFQVMMLLYSCIIMAPFALVFLMTMGLSMGGADLDGFFFFTVMAVAWSSLILFWLPLFMLVMPIRAAIKASDGLPYAYPLVWSPRRNAWKAYQVNAKPDATL